MGSARSDGGPEDWPPTLFAYPRSSATRMIFMLVVAEFG